MKTSIKNLLQPLALINLFIFTTPLIGMYSSMSFTLTAPPTVRVDTQPLPSAPSPFSCSVFTVSKGFEHSHHALSAIRESRQKQTGKNSTSSQNVRAQWIKSQMQGDVVSLKQIRHDLKQELKQAYFGRKKLLQEKIDFLTALIKSPLTQILATIKNGTLYEAECALRKIESQFGCAEDVVHTDLKVVQEFAAARRANGFDCVDVARAIFKSRADYNGCLDQPANQPLSLAEAQAAQAKTKTTREYTLSNNATELICHQQLDVKKFQSFTGNTLEHALHQRHLTILDEAADLHEKSNSYSVKQLAQATVQFIDIAHEHNKNGSIEQAEYMTDYSAATLYIAKEIAIGAAQGARQGIITTIDRICHPVDTIAGIAQGAASIGKAIFYMAADIGELEMLYETNVELATIRAKEISEKYKPIREELKKQISEMTLREWSRAVTAVATEGILQQKFLETTGKVMTNLEKGAVHLMESNPLATAEQYLATPEGILMKAAGGPEKNGPKLKDLGGKVRKVNSVTKQEFFKRADIKKNFEHYRNGIHKRKPNAKGLDEKIEYLHWDHLHNDVEAYNNSKVHMGSLDPETLQLYKAPVADRKFPI